MSYQTIRLLRAQDFLIYLTLLSFLSMPLLLLTGAAALIAV
jgi:hypothetical protein